MNITGKKIDNLQIAYIGGGSRGWAWGFMNDLAMDSDIQGHVRLYDIDMDAAKRNKIIGERISSHPDAVSNWKYSVSSSLEEALKGVDFVVISILPGTFAEMRSDVHEPEKYGIYQSVGDTVGPGGIIRAMRTIPMFVEIAQAIKDYSPNAWIINYTNPMSMCIRTLYEIFPKIKAFGCCHEVFGTQKLLCSMLEEKCGLENITRDQIATNVLGINHFTWIDKATYKNIDLFPLYKEFVDKYYESGYEESGDDNWMNNSFRSAQRVKFDLFRRYGLIAAAGDRHLAEFMPPWYLKDPETVTQWKFGLTTVDWRENNLKERLDRSDKLVDGTEQIVLKESGEEGHLLIKAILGLGDLISNVNIPNQGQIPNIPIGTIVETNALFRKDFIGPVYAGKVPESILSLIMPHIINQENSLYAALQCDKNLALNTFLNDPLVNLMPSDGEKLFNTMMSNTKKYLPENWNI